MPGLELYPEVTPGLVSQVMGAMRHSPGWEQYSLKHPRSTDNGVALVQNGVWALKVCHDYGRLVDAYLLKHRHYEEHYAWVDGFVFEDYRGQKHQYLQCQAWSLFEQWATLQGFPDLYCAVFVGNAASHRWTVDRCGFTMIGTRTKASPWAETGEYKDVWVYAKRAQGAIDAHLARKRADDVLAGKWQREKTAG